MPRSRGLTRERATSQHAADIDINIGFPTTRDRDLLKRVGSLDVSKIQPQLSNPMLPQTSTMQASSGGKGNGPTGKGGKGKGGKGGSTPLTALETELQSVVMASKDESDVSKFIFERILLTGET